MKRPSRHPARGAHLRPFLDALTVRYHRAALLGTDPLAVVRGFADPDDREFAALFAALLAYGNVKQINASLRDLFTRMGGAPARFIRAWSPADSFACLTAGGGFKHRFTDAEDLACLCHLLHHATRGGRTLEDVFIEGFDACEPDLVGAATRFVEALCAQPFAPHFDRARMLTKASFKHLLPVAARGSAAKRIHLFLRWVVRPDDGIDLGLWRRIPPEKLLIPVDTHIFRVGRNLGLIRRKTASLEAAREMTAALRAARPDDPVRYDFSLCRLGILGDCPPVSELARCRACDLHDVCARRRRLEPRTRRRG